MIRRVILPICCTNHPKPGVLFLRLSILIVVLNILIPGLSFANKPGLTNFPGNYINPFNGRDLTGWCYLDEKNEKVILESFDGKNESADNRFTGKEGILAINPWDEAKGPHWITLWTKQEYTGDFSLTIELRASVNADSGIFLHGKQLQCRDYLVAGPYKQLKKYKAQDWNKIKVIVKNNIARCTCNGGVLEEAFEIPRSGRFGIEADRGLMEYRNIRIKTLKQRVEY